MSSASVSLPSEQVNPSLSVDAYFLVPFPDDIRRTHLKLAEHPGVAIWLLSFLDYLLYKQGRIVEEQRIADPPGGATLDALIRGGVLLANRRPDGRQLLRLNSRIGELGLYVYARLAGRPALDTVVSLAGNPDLTRWLLNYHLGNSPGPGDPLVDEALAESLRQHGAFVAELPPPAATFPDTETAQDLASTLASMSAVLAQPAGLPVPAPVREVLGRHTPALPEGRSLLWGVDAGTGLVFPALAPQGAAALPTTFRGADAGRRSDFWTRQRAEARESLRTRRYATLRQIVPPAQQAELRRYVRQLVDRGYFPTVGLDKQVDLRRSMYRQPTVAALHNGLARLLSDIAGQPLIGSFNQLGLYEAGSVLEKHRDRPQCVLNLSLVLDMQGPPGEGEPPPWPIYIEMDGKMEAVNLEIGDGLVYSGVEVLHWRDALPAGQRAIVAFYFFVPPEFGGSLD